MAARERERVGRVGRLGDLREVEETRDHHLNRSLVGPTVSRHGELIFMVASSCREAEYGKWKKIFGVATLGFEYAGRA